MKRGFKAFAKRLAVELREEVNLSSAEPFDPWSLAEQWGIDVLPLLDVDCSAEAMRHFTVTNPGVFSGALIPVGTGAVIVENNTHHLVRRRATTSHEMAHVVLEHQFGGSLVNERGCRTADKTQEEEATELAGELVVPFEEAKRLARRDLIDEEVAAKFAVSVEIARWRMNATGARIIAARARDSYRRSRSRS